MKANELRIGNWVSITPHGQDDFIRIDYDEMEKLYTFATWDRINPIPLTEEWLVKFGFEKNCNENYQINYNQVCGISITLPDNNAWFCNLSALRFYEICNCSYVHQLQNLYFALTGKELESTQTQKI
jgi:hypothetical protein